MPSPAQRAILEKRGIQLARFGRYFDAGPVLEAETDAIRAISESQFIPAMQLMTERSLPAYHVQQPVPNSSVRY